MATLLAFAREQWRQDPFLYHRQQHVGTGDRRALARIRRKDELQRDRTVHSSRCRSIYARNRDIASSNPLVRAIVHEPQIRELLHGPISATVVPLERVIHRATKRGSPRQSLLVVEQSRQSDRVAMDPTDHMTRRPLEAMLPIAEADHVPRRAHVHLPVGHRRLLT